jgi:vacuolar-type H+-ATPase subunit H
LAYNGSNLSPNASITANLVLSFNVIIGLSESIITAARSFNVSREDLTFSYPISSLELLKVVGVRIVNGSITGTPSFEPGKDLERVKSAINSGVQRIKAAWERIKHYFDEAGKLIGELHEAAVNATTNAMESAENTAREVHEVAVNAVTNTARRVVRSTRQAVQTVSNDANRIVDSARQAVQTVQDASSQLAAQGIQAVESLTETGRQALSTARQAASEALNTGRNLANQVGNAVSEGASKAYSTISSGARSVFSSLNPFR